MKRFIFLMVGVVASVASAVEGSHTGAYLGRPVDQTAAIQSLLNQASACGLDRNLVAPLLQGAQPAVPVTPPPPVASLPPALPTLPVVPSQPSPTPTPSVTPQPVPDEKPVVKAEPQPEPSPEPTVEPETQARPTPKRVARQSTPEDDTTVDSDEPVPSVSKPSDRPQAKAHWISANNFPRRAVWAHPTEGRPGLWDFWDTELKLWRCT